MVLHSRLPAEPGDSRAVDKLSTAQLSGDGRTECSAAPWGLWPQVGPVQSGWWRPRACLIRWGMKFT